MTSPDPLRVEREADTITLTMANPSRRNAMSVRMLGELRNAVQEAGQSDASGVIIAADGPVFSAGHDLGELAQFDLEQTTEMLEICAGLMAAIHGVGQVVIARVHALATAAGCQLVAACDLAVAGESAEFAVPGGRGGWFCTTPMVEVGRSLPRKRALEMALTGDRIDATTALEWGLVNRVVPDAELEVATAALLERATHGAAHARAVGKPALHLQLGMGLDDAYTYATEIMATASQLPDAREMMTAFVEKRPPNYES
jgi:enoyl-CoA hydratase/carnithine racemase